MSNSLGKLFTVTSFGESHGRYLGTIIDGCPAGLALNETDIQPDLDRRKPGSGIGTTTRKEEDKVEIFSGIFNGITTGAPIPSGASSSWLSVSSATGFGAMNFV